MAKQTFTTGQVLTAAQMTALQQTAMLGGAANAKVASYVLVAADAGDAITMSNASPTTITVNTGLFAEGDIVTIINLGAGACTITAGTATVTTSGSLVLATNQGGVLRFTSASAAIFFQFATPASGDIEGVTAGVGISGGGTSGTVTITNSMATEIAAKGDLIVGTGSQTFDNLSVGTNGHTLVADSSTATGLKWAAPGGGSLTLLSTTTLSSTTTTVNLSSGYKGYRIILFDVTTGGGSSGYIRIYFNSTNNIIDYVNNIHVTGSDFSNGADNSSYHATGATSDGMDSTNTENSFYIEVYNADSTTANKNFIAASGCKDSSARRCINHGSGLIKTDSAISSFSVTTANGNLAGTALAYGVN